MKAHGGTTAQLATNQESLFVVYSGTTTRKSSTTNPNTSDGALTAFDIKRIIEKTEFDIIRPQWIHDCVRKGELVPLRKKYFFHPSSARMGDEEYDLSDSEDEASRAFTASGSAEDEDEVPRTLAKSNASGPELDSEHSEWFKVDPDDLKIPRKVDDSETEEDNDSDDCDLNEPDTVEDSDGGEWLSMPKENQAKSHSNIESNTEMQSRSYDSFDVIEVPQIQGLAVSFLPHIPPVFNPLNPDEAESERGSQDGRRSQCNAI